MPDSSPPESPDFPGLLPLVPAVGAPAVRRDPLPDAVAVFPVRIPPAVPPYDNPAALCPSDGPAHSSAAPSLATGVQITGVQATEAMAGQTARLAPPATGAFPSQFAQVLTETLAGSRPAGQIVPWTTEQTRRRIRQLGPLLATAQQPRLRRVIVTSPASGVLEMAIVVGIGQRVRAVAVRLEQAGQPAPALCTPAPSSDRWYCTAVEAA